MNAVSTDWWVPFIFGYPSLFFAIICSAIGIYLGKTVLLIASSIISLPHAIYLGSTPAYRYIGYGIPLFHAFAAYALAKKKIWLAITILIPFVVYTFWLLAVSARY